MGEIIDPVRHDIHIENTPPRENEGIKDGAGRVYAALANTLAGRLVDWTDFTGADWRLLLEMSAQDHEAVGPALHYRLRHDGWPPEMPDSIRDGLRRMFYNTSAVNSLLYADLVRIQTAFSKHAIPVIVLKGAALAVTVYEDAGMRSMGDLDLLVRPRDLQRAWKTLEDLGYIFLSANTEIALWKSDGNEKRVDLHWCLISGYSKRDHDLDWFAEPGIEIQIPGSRAPARGLPPETHLAYLASHAIGPQNLRAFYDMYLLETRCQPDWKRVEAVLDRAGWREIGLGMLDRMHRIFGLGPPVIEPLTGDAKIPGKSSRTNSLLASWTQLDLSTRLAVLARVVFPTRRYLEWRYRRRIRFSMPFWMLVRWLDVAWDFIRSSLRAERKTKAVSQT